MMDAVKSYLNSWACYPKGYNPNVHGPYNPSYYYGKPDTAFTETKISELPAWFARREKNPQALYGSFSRAFWRWNLKYSVTRKYSTVPYIQVAVFLSAGSLVLVYDRVSKEFIRKYHW